MYQECMVISLHFLLYFYLFSPPLITRPGSSHSYIIHATKKNKSVERGERRMTSSQFISSNFHHSLGIIDGESPVCISIIRCYIPYIRDDVLFAILSLSLTPTHHIVAIVKMQAQTSKHKHRQPSQSQPRAHSPHHLLLYRQ